MRVPTKDKTQEGLLLSGRLLPIMEEFYTIQGEGYNAGKAAYFVRIGGCDVGCHWCDVKESWDAALHPLTYTDSVVNNAIKFPAKAVVVTGGEPTMYNLAYLTEQLKNNAIDTYIETSGAYELTGQWNWICLSPKKTMEPRQGVCKVADELKIIIHNKDDFKWAEKNAVKVSAMCRLFLQPEWSKRDEVMPLIVDYVMNNPKWMVSLQTHKYMRIP